MILSNKLRTISYIKKLLSKRYGIYHLRWQVSAWVMLPFMMLLEAHLPLWGNLMLGQFIGALIFYPIDTFIFKSESTTS